MRIGRLTVQGGFVLLWGVLIYVEQWRLLLYCSLAALLHELGHGLAVALCGGRIEGLELNAQGAVLRLSGAKVMGYGREIFCCLAGPGMSLLCALLFSRFCDIIPNTMPLAGLCLLQGLFNLLPAAGLDGGAALRLGLEVRESPYTERALRVGTLVSALAVAAVFGAAFALSGRNWLFVLAGGSAVTAVLGERILPERESKTQKHKRNERYQ